MVATMTEQAQAVFGQFFVRAIEGNRLAHAYILKGRNSAALYQRALDTARMLNCQKSANPAESCSPNAPDICTSCRWVNNNAHPAVMTISRLTYLVSDVGNDLGPDDMQKLLKKSASTQIKAEQLNRLLQQLGRSSEHYRVVIFTDAEELPSTVPSTVPPPGDWASVPGNEEKSLHIRPLSARIFNASSANRFLKTLEEPPPRTVFFFITDDESNLLDTIVSRCQVVPFMRDVAGDDTLSDTRRAFLQKLLQSAPGSRDFYRLSGEFSRFVDEEGLSPVQGIDLLQRCLHRQFQTDPAECFKPDLAGLRQYRKRQQALEDARKMLEAKVHGEQAINRLFQTLCEG